jgi:hypothetical protein
MISELADDDDLSPKEILDRVVRTNPELKIGLRTVQRKVHDLRAARAAGEIWTLSPSDDDDAPLVLRSLVWRLRISRGRGRTLSRETARWIAAVARAVPDLHPWSVYRVARQYMERSAAGKSTEGLDIYLALGPWRDDDARAEYEALIANGSIDRTLLYRGEDLTEWNVTANYVGSRALLEFAQEHGFARLESTTRAQLAQLPVPEAEAFFVSLLVQEHKRRLEGLPPALWPSLETPDPDWEVRAGHGQSTTNADGDDVAPR